MNDDTILWFDFETFGSLPRPWDGGRSGPYPRRDRPSQFGAIRTNLDLEVGSHRSESTVLRSTMICFYAGRWP